MFQSLVSVLRSIAALFNNGMKEAEGRVETDVIVRVEQPTQQVANGFHLVKALQDVRGRDWQL